MKRTNLIALFPAIATAASLSFAGLLGMAHADTHTSHGAMHVTKSPTCGCCTAWVELARNEGYTVEVANTRDYVGPATIDGYVVEGHVPFATLERLLEARPHIAGISVPGMPAGSPGMGNDPDARFDVIAFGEDAEGGEVFYRAGLE